MVAAACGSPAPFLLFFLPCPPCRDSAPGLPLPGEPPSSGGFGELSPPCSPFPLPGASASLGAPLSPRVRGMGPGAGVEAGGGKQGWGAASP